MSVAHCRFFAAMRRRRSAARLSTGLATSPWRRFLAPGTNTMKRAAEMPPSQDEPGFTEAERLEALHALHLLDTQPEAMFDSLTNLAAAVFQVPASLISLIDAERQWFKSCFGLEG